MAPRDEATATSAAWTPIGPFLGTFTSVVGAPGDADVVYASTLLGGVWVSADRGATWAHAGEPPSGPGNVTNQIEAVDQTDSATLYALTPAGISKSVDGGADWTVLRSDLRNLVVAPSAARVLYAIQPVSATAPASVWRSPDGGGSWALAGTLPVAGFPTALLAVSPADPQTVYALGAGGFARSTDGGATWGAPFSPFTASDAPLGVFAGAGGAVYIAASRLAGEPGIGVFRSSDGGATWTSAGAGLPAVLTSFVLAPSGDLYAGSFIDVAGITHCYQSTDGGASWHQVAPVGMQARLAAAAAGAPDALFALTAVSGLLSSPDQGQTWITPAQPPSAADMYRVAAGPLSEPQSLFAVGLGFDPLQSAETIWSLGTSGATWEPIAPPNSAFQLLLIDAQPGVLYAVPQPPLSEPSITLNGGATWQTLSNPPTPTGSWPVALATDPLLPGKVVRLGCIIDASGPSAFVCHQMQIHLTNTFGRGWRLLGQVATTVATTTSSAPVAQVRLDAANPTRAYAVLPNSLFASVPGSTNLAVLPLAGPFVDLAVVSNGAVGAGKVPTLYAALGSKRQRVLFKSTDGGTTWVAASAGLPRNASVVSLIADPTTPQTLYLQTETQIFVTDDGAATWQALPLTGLPRGPYIGGIAASQTAPRKLYAASVDAGVFELAHP